MKNKLPHITIPANYNPIIRSIEDLDLEHREQINLEGKIPCECIEDWSCGVAEFKKGKKYYGEDEDSYCDGWGVGVYYFNYVGCSRYFTIDEFTKHFKILNVKS